MSREPSSDDNDDDGNHWQERIKRDGEKEGEGDLGNVSRGHTRGKGEREGGRLQEGKETDEEEALERGKEGCIERGGGEMRGGGSA